MVVYFSLDNVYNNHNIKRTSDTNVVGYTTGSRAQRFCRHTAAGRRKSRSHRGPSCHSCQLKVKLHVFDLLWICCTTSCTTSPQQIHNKSKAVQQIHNKSTTTLASTTNPQHLDMPRCCTTNRKPPTSPRQVHNKSKQWSLATTCCGFAVALQPSTEENWHDV